MHLYLKDQEIEKLREAGRSSANVLKKVVENIQAGITTYELDKLAERWISDLKAHSAPKKHENFPGSICISVNEIIAHGIPDRRRLQCGDLVNIDVSLEKDGFFGDVGYSLVVGSTDNYLNDLCEFSRNTLFATIDKCVPGTQWKEVAAFIENSAKSKGYTVIQNLCSHGIGKNLHEYNISNVVVDEDEDDFLLQEGMVLALEPFISTDACRATDSDDGWSLTTHNNSKVVQFEHTIRICSEGPEILTVV